MRYDKYRLVCTPQHGELEWLRNGSYHRIGGPAYTMVQQSVGDRMTLLNSWFLFGRYYGNHTAYQAALRLYLNGVSDDGKLWRRI